MVQFSLRRSSGCLELFFDGGSDSQIALGFESVDNDIESFGLGMFEVLLNHPDFNRVEWSFHVNCQVGVLCLNSPE